MDNKVDRRNFLKQAFFYTGAMAVFPMGISCRRKEAEIGIPLVKPENWDPIDFNRKRGKQGAIPKSYLPEIMGSDGVEKHLGKHLPYVPDIPEGKIPEGYLPLMWGDPKKGYTMHPNAKVGPANQFEGHWFNWIQIRKSHPGKAETAKTVYSDWPFTRPSDTGRFITANGIDIRVNSGKNTVYLAVLPSGLSPGDTIRIWAHCLTHGEYVDFITI